MGGDRQTATNSARLQRIASRSRCGCGIRRLAASLATARVPPPPSVLRQAHPSIPVVRAHGSAGWAGIRRLLVTAPAPARDRSADAAAQRSAARRVAAAVWLAHSLTLGHCAGSDGEQQQDGQQGEAQRGAVASGARRLAHGDGLRCVWNSGRRCPTRHCRR